MTTIIMDRTKIKWIHHLSLLICGLTFSTYVIANTVKEKLNDGTVEKIIAEEMKKAIQANYPLERFELPREEAIKFMQEKEEPYKVQLIEDLQNIYCKRESGYISFQNKRFRVLLSSNNF